MRKFLILLLLSGGSLFAQAQIPEDYQLLKLSKTEVEGDKLLQSLFYYYQFTDQIEAGELDKEKTIFKARELAEEYFAQHQEPLYKAYLGLVESCCLKYRVFPIVVFKSRGAIKLLEEAVQEEPNHWQIRYYRLISFVNYPSKYYDFEDTILADYYFLLETKDQFLHTLANIFVGRYYLEQPKEPQEAKKYLDKVSKAQAKVVGMQDDLLQMKAKLTKALGQ